MIEQNNPRDTQFRGFAKALMRDLEAVSITTYASIDKAKEAYELAVARRAYDLAVHAVGSFQSQVYRQPNSSQLKKYLSRFCEEVLWIDQIPDMPELPKRSDQ